MALLDKSKRIRENLGHRVSDSVPSVMHPGTEVQSIIQSHPPPIIETIDSQTRPHPLHVTYTDPTDIIANYAALIEGTMARITMTQPVTWR
jgi:hypothetical protein